MQRWMTSCCDDGPPYLVMLVRSSRHANDCLQIRKQLASEFTSDLKGVSEENASLLRESLSSSLEKMFAAPVTIASDDEGERVHPDMEE